MQLLRTHGKYEPDEPVVAYLASVFVDGASDEAGKGGRGAGGEGGPLYRPARRNCPL